VTYSSLWFWLNPDVVRERRYAYDRKQYEQMSGLEYNRKLLANRRRSALKRITERNEGRAANG
jgi:hypothetical protein